MTCSSEGLSPRSAGDALGCATLKVADVKAGTVAVTVTADSGWIVVGSDTYRSDGSFGTWTKS
ncbi:hypothetical protein ABEG17_06335 [Pedococcus sp. KACC 23699]|uniref:Uncharacterized protein n=1 Tax=Pedococcus sp. KACC 23699 TaxID=3149228 RepID=A0AAU7JWZ2_9MICO